MKKLLAVVLLVVFAPACSLFTPAVVRTALDVVQYACIIANQDLPSSTAIADACKVDQSLAPIIELLVSEYKLKAAEQQLKMQAAPPCR